jgi:hypothetical protein
MNEAFDIVLPNRRITVTPDDSDHLVNGFVVGCFELSEDDVQQGTICFGETSWEYDERGSLTTEEVEGLADEIIFYYKQDELAGGYVDYQENKITVFNEDEEIIALIEMDDNHWSQTAGEKLSDETIAAYVKGIDDFK